MSLAFTRIHQCAEIIMIPTIIGQCAHHARCITIGQCAHHARCTTIGQCAHHARCTIIYSQSVRQLHCALHRLTKPTVLQLARISRMLRSPLLTTKQPVFTTIVNYTNRAGRLRLLSHPAYRAGCTLCIHSPSLALYLVDSCASFTVTGSSAHFTDVSSRGHLRCG